MVPDSGAYVLAPEHGLWNFTAASISGGLLRTFLVAWDLIPGDRALDYANLRVRELGPHSLLQNVQLYFHIASELPNAPIPVMGSSLLRETTSVGPNPLLAEPKPPEPVDLRSAAIPTGAGKPIYRNSPVTVGTSMLEYVRRAAHQRGLDPTLAMGVISTESRFEPYPPDSRAGAMGPMQIMPDTARTIGLANPRDPAANINAGLNLLAIYIRRYAGDIQKALIAYHSGPGKVDKPSNADREYIAEVSRFQAMFRLTERDALINESP